jgi:serine protease Do
MKSTIKTLLATAALGAAVAGAGFFGATAPEPAHAGPLGADGSIADVTERVLPSVVNISTTTVINRAETPYANDPFFEEFFGRRRRGREQYGHSLGSGVIVSSKGYILTNNHVVANAKDIKVSLSDGREVTATLVGADPKSDLAVLKVKGQVTNLKPIPLGDSDKLRLGDVVLAVGNPFGVGQAVTMGIVSAKGRANMGIVDYEDFIQTDAAINPGNSGGALINLRGELVGINTAILSRTGGYQGIGFAIPTGMARPIMDSLIAKGKVVRGWLGVSIRDVNRELSESHRLSLDRGVWIDGVVPGGPAAKAGIRRGDVVVSINHRACDKAAHLRNAVAAATVGKAVQVEIVRDGKRQNLAVVLAEAPRDTEGVLGERGGGREERGGPEGREVKLGVKVVPLDGAARARYDIPRDVTHGVVVTSVSRDGLAGEIGLQPGDVIIQVNRSAVRSARQLDAAYQKSTDKIAMLIYRDGATQYLLLEK